MTTKNETAAASRLNDEAYEIVCKLLKKKTPRTDPDGRTVEELANAADVDHRTVYRYLRRLQDDEGAAVIRRGSGRPIRYEILIR